MKIKHGKMKPKKFVIDTTPLITLLLIICGDSKEENKAKNECEKYNKKFFSQFGSEEKRVRENIYKHITYMIKNNMIKNIIVTPHILTETYDLLDSKYGMKGERQEGFWMSVMDFIKKISEECVKKEDILNYKPNNKEMFVEYGFADTSVYLAAKKLKNENKEYEWLLITGEGKLKSLSGNDGFHVVGLEDIFWKWESEESYYKS